ncbi:hypothetical protein D3C73_1548610 [compost metagenome]
MENSDVVKLAPKCLIVSKPDSEFDGILKRQDWMPCNCISDSACFSKPINTPLRRKSG